MKNSKDPFSYDFVQFSALDSKDRDLVIAKEKEQTKQFVKKYFDDNPKIAWVVIAKSPQNVIQKGENEFEPLDLDLPGLARKVNAPIFLHFR
jgi:hypothetical protein